MNTIRILFTAFLIGIISGSAAMYFLLNQHPAFKSDEIKVTQISGEKIYHNDFNISGDTIKFKTISDGKGEIETDIPKMLIPEAANWMNRVQSVTLTYGYKFDRYGVDPYVGVLYSYRFGRVTLGGGTDLSYDFIGVKAAAGFCW